MEKEIIEGNKLIAEFEGRINELCHHNNTSSPYDYDKSWDWLMPVLTKIGNDTGHELVIHAETSYWNQFGDNSLITDFLGYEYPLQDGIWRAVVEFIKWYNEKKNQ